MYIEIQVNMIRGFSTLRCIAFEITISSVEKSWLLTFVLTNVGITGFFNNLLYLRPVIRTG
jgi:hypothetical protein